MLLASHNDYMMQNKPFFDAFNHGVTIFECDLVKFLGKIRVGHSWIECVFKPPGNMEDMYLWVMTAIASLRDEPEYYLKIDIKTGSKKVIKYLEKCFEKFSAPKLTFSITAGDNWFTKLIRRRRVKIKEMILKKFGSKYKVVDSKTAPRYKNIEYFITNKK